MGLGRNNNQWLAKYHLLFYHEGIVPMFPDGVRFFLDVFSSKYFMGRYCFF